MPTQHDLAFAKAALRRGVAAKDVLQKCLAAVSKLEKAGKARTLKEILLDLKVLDAKQADEIDAILQQPRPDAKTTLRQQEAIKHGHVLEGSEFCDRCADYVPESDITEGRAVRTPDGRVLCFRCLGVDAQEGDVVAGYRLGSRLRSTNLGNMYKAVHLATSRECCLEIIPEKNLRDRVPVKRLVEAAIYSAKFEHPRIIQTIEAVQWQEGVYVSRAFVPHVPLLQVLADAPSGKLSVRKALRIVTDLAEALVFAFEKSIFDGSIRPAKVAVTEGPRACLMDLALPDLSYNVRARDDKPDPYAAPELQGAGEIDIRADIYSLGQILCEILTGGHWKQPDPPARPFDDAVPVFVRRVVEKATNPDMKGRYSTPLALLRDLHVASQRYDVLIKRKAEIDRELQRLSSELQGCGARLKVVDEKVRQEDVRWSKQLDALQQQANEQQNAIDSASDRKGRREAKRRLKQIHSEIKLGEKEHIAVLQTLTRDTADGQKYRKKLLAEQAKRQREIDRLYTG